MAKALNSFSFLHLGPGNEVEVGIQNINPGVFEALLYFLAKVGAPFAQDFERGSSDMGDHGVDFVMEGLVDLFQRRPAALHQIPDGDGELAGYCGHGQVAAAFAGEEFFAPFGQGIVGAAQDGLGGLDQQTAQVFAPVTADAAAPLSFSAVVKGRIEANIFDEFFGAGETADVTQDRAQGKGDHFAHPAEAGHGQQGRVGQDFLGDEAAPVAALLFGVAQGHEHPFDDLPLTRRPRAGFLQEVLG